MRRVWRSGSGNEIGPRRCFACSGRARQPEIAGRLLSKDGTVALVAVPLSTSFVAPATHEAVAWLQSQARADRLDLPEGLEVRWAGDALIGRDYMSNVQTSLDRAAVATVLLLARRPVRGLTAPSGWPSFHWRRSGSAW